MITEAKGYVGWCRPGTSVPDKLRRISLAVIDPCLTYSGISDALATLNEGFDECRTVCDCAP